MASENKASKKGFSRRKFLKRGAIVLGGTLVATYVGRHAVRRYLAQTVEEIDIPALISSYEPAFWFEVRPDNTILMKSPKIEMGQGIFTGFAMLAAEELEVSLDQIRVEHAHTSSGPIDKVSTGGSNSTSSLFTPIREVAATMREMLKTAAANKWRVEIATVQAHDGVLTSGNHRMTYTEITSATKEWEIPRTPTLKPVSDFKYVGKDVTRVDAKPKILGKPLFALDAQLPGMLYAVILRSPYIGGTLQHIDTQEAAASTHVVKVVEEKDLIAVVATTRYAAEMALQKIKVEWNVPKKWQQTDFEQLVTVGVGKPVNVQDEGNAPSVLAENAAHVFKQQYRTPMAAHAHMEPNGTVAHFEEKGVKIIIGTQGPGLVRSTVAKALGLEEEQVQVEVAYSGGGFGRRGLFNNAVEAALISKAVGKPVHVFNTREQEFQNSHYRPNTHHVLQAKIAPDGTIEAVTHDQATPDMILSMIPGNLGYTLLGADFVSAGHGASILYNIEHRSTTIWQNKLPIPTGIWRSVGILPNTFAVESFFNELAHQTGKDPIAFRLGLLAGSNKLNARYKNVLETLAEKSGWNQPKEAGIGRGMAICNDRKTIAATAMEISLVEGQIRVKKVTNVLDAGLCVNPEGVRMQVEGCVMMGITAALYEELLITDGQIAANFHQYPMASLQDTPDTIQTIILEGDDQPYGVGEPPLGPIAPAIAAAVFDLTGKRLRSLPLKPDKPVV